MSAFLDLHRAGDPLPCPNPQDAGSAAELRQAGTTDYARLRAIGRQAAVRACG